MQLLLKKIFDWCLQIVIHFVNRLCNLLLQMKPGVILKILCCSAELIMINTLGVYLFNLRTFPDWANTTEIFSAQGSHYDSLWTAASNATTAGNFSLTTTLLPILQNSTVL